MNDKSSKRTPTTLVYIFSFAFSILFLFAILRFALSREMKPSQKYLFEAISKTISIMVLVYGLIKICKFAHKPQTQSRFNKIRYQSTTKEAVEVFESIFIRADDAKGLVNFAEFEKKKELINQTLRSGDASGRVLETCVVAVVFAILLMLILGFMGAKEDIAKSTESVAVWVEFALPLLAFIVTYVLYSHKGTFLKVFDFAGDLQSMRGLIKTKSEQLEDFRSRMPQTYEIASVIASTSQNSFSMNSEG